MKIDERYKGHAKALSKAGLAPKIYPTLKEIWKKADALKMKNTQSVKIEVEEENKVPIFV